MKKELLALCLAAIALNGCSSDCQDGCDTQTDDMLSSQSLALFGETGGAPWGSEATKSFYASSVKANQRFGQHLGVADITGDGKPDIVTARGTEGHLGTHGRVRVYDPNGFSLINVDFTKNDTSIIDSYGYALAAGNFCPELGVDVIVASAPDYNNIKGGFGIIYKQDKKYRTQVRMLQPAVNNQYPMAGTQLTVGDVNGDGKNDLVFQSSPMDMEYQNLTTKVSVLLDVCNQKSGSDFSVSASIEGSSADSAFGSALYVAELDGKGKPEIIVVDNLYRAPGNPVSANGAIYFYKYENGTLVESRKPIIGEQTEKYGASIESVAFSDIDGDGDLDLIVGEPMVQTSGKREGRVRTYTNQGASKEFDASDMKWSAVGGTSNARFGSSVTISDVNHDGVNDLIVGAPGYRASASTERAQARVLVYMGTKDGSIFSKQPFWTYVSDVSTSMNDDFGRSIAAADLDNQGWNDLIIGAPGYGSSATSLDEGRVDIFMQTDGHCYTANGCFVQNDGKCYLASEVNETNKCQVCDPTVNNFDLVALTCEGTADVCRDAATCDPAVGCQITNKPDGTSCGNDVCHSNNYFGTFSCQAGECVEEKTHCGNFLCYVPNTGCPTSCTKDDDCVQNNVCVDGTCTEKTNDAPIVILPSAKVDTTPGGTFSIDASKSYDPNDDDISFYWECTGNLALDNNLLPELGVNVPKDAIAGSSEVCTVTVTDTEGAYTNASVIININEPAQNSSPVIVVITTHQVQVGETVNIDASESYDPEGTKLSFKWSSPDDIVLNNYESSTTAFTVPKTIGRTFQVNLEVTDEDGYANQTSIQYHVVNAGNHFIDIATPQNDASVQNPVTISGTATENGIVIVQNLNANTEVCRAMASADGFWECTATLDPDDYRIQAHLVAEDYSLLAFSNEINIHVVAGSTVINPPTILSPTNTDIISLRPTVSGTIQSGASGKVHVWQATSQDKATLLCTAEIKPNNLWACTASYDLQPATNYTLTANWETPDEIFSKMSEPVSVQTQAADVADITILSPTEGAQYKSNYAMIIGGTGPAGSAVDVYAKEIDGSDIHLCSAFISQDGYWACYDVLLNPGTYSIYADDAATIDIIPSNIVNFTIHGEVIEPDNNYEETRGGSCSMTTTHASNFGWISLVAAFAGFALMRRRRNA